jgi:hypothetical protein
MPPGGVEDEDEEYVDCDGLKQVCQAVDGDRSVLTLWWLMWQRIIPKQCLMNCRTGESQRILELWLIDANSVSSYRLYNII